MHVLVVEDEKKTANFIAKGLKEQGFVVDVVNNGDDGYLLATTEPFDAIILDNATSHNPARINYYMARYGIAVAFLPRYWPEWNPIELAWNWLRLYLKK